MQTSVEGKVQQVRAARMQRLVLAGGAAAIRAAALTGCSGGRAIQSQSAARPGDCAALAQFERRKGLPAAQFDDAVARLSAADVAAAAHSHALTVQQYHRLFMLPNVGHCRGGNGPSTIGGGTGDPPPSIRNANTDIVLALARWVEQGVAPETIVAASLGDGVVLRQRPLCVYPKQARYKGSGDSNATASFTCVAPGAEQPGASAADLNQIRNSLRQRALLGPVR